MSCCARYKLPAPSEKSVTSASLFLPILLSLSLTCRLGVNLTLSHLLLNFTGAALSNEAPWCTFANFCLCHCGIIGMWLSMNTQRRVGWPLGDLANSAFVIMEVLSHIIWEWRGIVCRVPGMEMNWYNSLLLCTTEQKGKKLQDTFFYMLIMKTFSFYLLPLCVYWSRRAASGKSRGGFFRKGGSFDAVALERISLYVCICQPFSCVGAPCTDAHVSVYVCLLMTL